MMFDWDKVHKLLSVMEMARGYPGLTHMHNAAMKELTDMKGPDEEESKPDDSKGYYRRRLGDDK